MWYPVFDKRITLGSEAKRAVPVSEIRLRGEHPGPLCARQYVFEQTRGGAPAPGHPHGQNPSDAALVAVIEHSQVGDAASVGLEPHMPCRRLYIATIELRVCALLLHDKHVCTKARNVVPDTRRNRVELCFIGHCIRCSAHSGTTRTPLNVAKLVSMAVDTKSRMKGCSAWSSRLAA